MQQSFLVAVFGPNFRASFVLQRFFWRFFCQFGLEKRFPETIADLWRLGIIKLNF